ncbi:hypothetical protein [Pseudomonas aeruginosa]
MTAEKPNQDPGKINDELRLLYTSCVSEVAGFKQQQWNVTNCGLLSYAAIASLPKLVASKLVWWELAVLYALAIAVLIVGWYLVGVLDASIKLRRARLEAVRKHFTREFRDARLAGQPEEKKLNLSWFFRAVFIAGFVVTIWLLTRYAHAG